MIISITKFLYSITYLITGKILAAFNYLWRLIKTPFIIIANYYRQISPLINHIASLFNRSAIDLCVNFTAILTFFTALSAKVPLQ